MVGTFYFSISNIFEFQLWYVFVKTYDCLFGSGGYVMVPHCGFDFHFFSDLGSFFFLAIWLSCVVKCCVQVICVQISLFYCLVFSPWLFIYYRVYGVLGYDPHVEVRGLLFGVSSLLLVSYGAWGWTQVVRLVPLCFAPEQLTPPWRNSVAVYVIMLLPLPLACCFTLVVILSSLLWIF